MTPPTDALLRDGFTIAARSAEARGECVRHWPEQLIGVLTGVVGSQLHGACGFAIDPIRPRPLATRRIGRTRLRSPASVEQRREATRGIPRRMRARPERLD